MSLWLCCLGAFLPFLTTGSGVAVNEVSKVMNANSCCCCPDEVLDWECHWVSGNLGDKRIGTANNPLA